MPVLRTPVGHPAPTIRRPVACPARGRQTRVQLRRAAPRPPVPVRGRRRAGRRPPTPAQPWPGNGRAPDAGEGPRRTGPRWTTGLSTPDRATATARFPEHPRRWPPWPEGARSEARPGAGRGHNPRAAQAKTPTATGCATHRAGGPRVTDTDPDSVLDKTFDEKPAGEVLVRDIPISELRAPPAPFKRCRARGSRPRARRPGHRAEQDRPAGATSTPGARRSRSGSRRRFARRAGAQGIPQGVIVVIDAEHLLWR